MEEDDDIDDEKEKEKVPFEVAIDFAAEQTLHEETARLCKLSRKRVVRRGGLQVVGTALHESRRIDRTIKRSCRKTR